MKILLSTGIICYLISVQSQICWILKTKYYVFRILGNLKHFKT